MIFHPQSLSHLQLESKPPNNSTEPTPVGAFGHSITTVARRAGGFGVGSAFVVRWLNRMKQCTYCGKEYPDEATVCAIDERPLRKAVPPKNVQVHNDFFLSSFLRRHYQREAQSLAASKPVRICACGAIFSPTQVSRSYLWGLIPFGDTITYLCPSCKMSVEISSPLRLVVSFISLVLCGCGFSACIWLWTQKYRDNPVVIGTLLFGAGFCCGLYFHISALHSWLKYRRRKRDSTGMGSSPLTASEQLLRQGINAVNVQAWDEALTCFDRALEINPNLGEAWLRRGVALISMHRFPDAIASLEKADQLGQKEAGNLLNYWRTKIRS